MKRLLTIVAFIFSFMFVMAQTSNNHLTFKGIPITGTVESFAQKLVSKGFKKIDSDKTNVVFEGEFAGYSGCRICVCKNSNRNIVYQVAVDFPTEDSWARLEKEYNQFKNVLTNKYGEPALHSEKFKEGTSTLSDEAKKRSVKMYNCDYWATWEVENGHIEVNIVSGIFSYDGHILLTYFDKINGALVDKAKADDL